MKKQLFICLALFTMSAYANHCGSRTFFEPRQITTDSTYELALTNYDFYHNFASLNCRPFVNFYVTPFFQKSTNSRALAEYFLPHNKSTITIREDGTGDVGSLWLGLIAPKGEGYKSRFTIHPERKTFGAHFNTYFNLDCICTGMWFGVAFAAVKADHFLCPREFDREAQGTFDSIRNALDAFNNPTWTAAKFSQRKLCKVGVDDIEFKLGYDHFDCDLNHLGAYVVATAPTGHREHSRYIFEPVVGSKHGSLGVGLNGDFTFWRECNQTLDIMFDLKYRYVFAASERRSFDLRQNDDWSRYLLIAPEDRPYTSLPAINLLTSGVRVEPKSTIDFWTALHYAYCSFNVEFGYNLWWREAERVCLKCPFIPKYGIFDLSDQCNPDATSSSQANISQSIIGQNKTQSDPFFKVINKTDLNLQSAAHPHALSHKIYGAVAYNSVVCSFPYLLGIGGSFEFAHPKRNALEQWAVWGKLGISF